MSVTIIYGKCDSKMNARERRRIKRENERKSSPAINKTDNVDKLFDLQTRKDANQIALKNVAKDQ